jgi:hypothetical protein
MTLLDEIGRSAVAAVREPQECSIPFLIARTFYLGIREVTEPAVHLATEGHPRRKLAVRRGVTELL